MPWSASDAKRFTKKASTPELAQKWASTANRELERAKAQGVKNPEAHAIKIANWLMLTGRTGR